MDSQPQPIPPQSPEPQPAQSDTPELPAVQPASPAPAASPPAAAPIPQPAPAPVVPVATPSITQPTTDGPAIAEDVDVIEKEWVDKAEQIVAQTAGDPHAEEEAVEDLQIDYLKKRYGKDVKKSED